MVSFASRRDRIAGAALAMLVQAGFLALLVVSRTQTQPPAQLVHELILFLPRLTVPNLQPAPTVIDARGNPRPIVPAPAVPSIALPPAAPSMTAPPPDISGLGQSIFGCAPETWSGLTPEQRVRCPRPGEGVTVRNAPDLLHPPPSQSKDSAHWAAELASRKSIRVPCTSIENQAAGDQVLMVDPVCAVKELQELRKKLR